ncbi:AraC family transcriptional regulator [Vallitaleaceae bacterium 9-2]
MLSSFNHELEKLHGFETDYVKILYYDLPQNFSDIYKTHHYARFCTILNGEKKIQVKNKIFSYSTSESLLLPAHSKVEMTIEEPTQALVFELNDELIQSVIKKTSKELPQSRHGNIQEVLVNNLHRNIKDDVALLIQKSRFKKEQDPFLIDLYAQKLIYDLLEFDQASSVIMQQCQTPMDQAKKWIETHIYDTIAVKDVASALHMSESNFSHAFKKHANMSPQKYIHLRKLKKSLELLKATSVTDAAFSLGYENPSYFIQLFKREFGMTPKQYQLNKY